MWLTVGLALAGAAWYGLHTGLGAGPVAVGYVFVPAGMAVAALATHRLSRGVPMDRAACRFWRRLTAALAVLAAGYTLHAVDVARHTVDGRLPTMPVPVAACLVAGIGIAIWAVVRTPEGTRSPAQRWRARLDRAIAFLGSATALWYVGLAPMMTAAHPWSTQSLVVTALAFLLATGGIAKLSYAGTGPVHPGALRLLGATGVTAAVVAVLAVGLGDAGAVPAQSLVMPTAPVLAALAAHVQASRPPGTGRMDALLPYLAVAAVTMPLLLVASGPMHWSNRAVVVAAVAVTALVAVRQYVASRDNRRLLRERKAHQRRLQHEVTHDALTGLGNRALFRDTLAAALRDGTGATVLMVDLDDFKAVNDSLGHDVGDQLLVAVAGALRGAVGDDGLPVRVGGDEFAVLLPGADAPADEVAQRVLDVLSRPVGAHGLLAQASIGVAGAPAGTPPDRVLRDADVAMYAAKQRGKSGYVRYAPGMEEPVVVHAQLGGELRRALDAGEFRVVYQPVVRLADRRLIGVESLVRWEHPLRGTVSPAEFIPAAERTGLIVPLGRYVLRETCRQGAAWLAEFGPDALRKVGPNVSARQLHDPDFVSDVADALAESGLPADRLVLELTESAVLRGRQISTTLHRLDRMGVKLALDDFGTGESSLSLLRSFPAAIVKLDKSFVDGLELDDEGPGARQAREAVARAVIQLAGALGLDAVAEGIENAGQAARLRALGYTLGQGYHLGRPMAAGDLRRLLADQAVVGVPAT